MAFNHKLKFTIDADGKGARAELNSVDKMIDRMGAKSRSGGGIAEIFGGNLAANAVSKLSSALLEGGKTVLDYSSRMEQTKIGFETLMGGAVQAQQHLAELKRFAAATPFEFEDLTRASRRLQNVGLEGKKVIPVMKDIGNAAAAAGASSAELDSITLAFSQIIAKGKLSAEEVNQLAERGIPVWRMLSEEMGKSKGEIIKLAEQGKISSEVFLDAFRKFSQANFGDAMQRQSKTFAGAMSTIKDATLETATVAFKPIYEEVSKFAVNVADSLGRQQAQVNNAGLGFGQSLGTAIGVGIRQSGVGQQSWWENLLFAGKDLGMSAYEFGKGIARGAREGFNQGFNETGTNPSGVGLTYDPATNTMVGGTAPGGTTAPGGAPPLTPPAAAIAKVNTVAIGQYRMTQKEINDLALESFQERNEREFSLWDAQQQTIIARFKADLAIKAVSEAEYQAKVRLYEDERLAGTLANLELEKKKRAELGMNTRDVDNQISIQKETIERRMYERREEDVNRKREDEKKELEHLKQKSKAWKEYLQDLEREQAIKDETAAKEGRGRYEQGTVTGGTGIGAGIAQGMGIELVPMFDEATNAMLTFQERMAMVGNEINNFVGQSIGGLIDGLSQMGAAWLVTGEFSAKAALQMAAGAALGIAMQAGVKAIFEFAEAAAAAARLDFYGASMHTAAAWLYVKTAAIAGAIGVGLGLAGRAVGGGSKSASSSGSSSSSNSNQQQPLAPYSRHSDDVYISGQRRTNPVAIAVEMLTKKLDSMTAGDVLVAGSRQKRGFIGTQAVDDMKTRPQLGSRMLRQANAR